MAKGSLRVNGIIVDTDGEIKASTGDSIVIREDDGSAVITVDTNGKTSIGGPMDVGVDDTGHDVKFFGATSGKYMLWDESADSLIVDGKVGIGTTTPDSGLHIASADPNGTSWQKLTHNAIISWEMYATGSSGSEDDLTFKNSANGDVFTLDRDKKVGIGTTSPQSLLQVNGSGTGGAGEISITRVDTSQTLASGSALGYIFFGAQDADSTLDKDATQIVSHCEEAWTSSAHGSRLQFFTTTSGTTTAAERMRIDNAGKVGIGTTSPATILDVADDQSNGSGKTEVMRLYSGADIADDGPYLVLSTGMGDCRLGSYRQAYGGTVGGSTFYITSAHNDGTGGATATTEKFRVQSNGRVGIGSTSPDHELVIGPVSPAADEGNTIEMRGAAGDSGLQRFQIDNRGDIGQAALKLGRGGSTPTTYVGIGPDDIEFSVPFVQNTSNHTKIRQFYYTATISNGNAVNLFRNTNAYDDLNGIYWAEVTHSGRTYQTRTFTLGGYGLNLSSGGTSGSFDITSTATGMPGGTQALRLNNNTGYTAGVWIAGFILGDNAVTNISATIYD